MLSRRFFLKTHETHRLATMNSTNPYSGDPYRNSKMKVRDHLKALIEIMSFKFQAPKPRELKNKCNWVRTVEDGVVYLQAVAEEEPYARPRNRFARFLAAVHGKVLN